MSSTETCRMTLMKSRPVITCATYINWSSSREIRLDIHLVR